VRNANTLKQIRHNAIGHRDNDMMNQLKSISSIKWIDSISLVSEFDNILNEFGVLSQSLINNFIDELND
jgi:hypothetical protein